MYIILGLLMIGGTKNEKRRKGKGKKKMLYDYSAEELRDAVLAVSKEVKNSHFIDVATNCAEIRIPVQPVMTKTSYECPKCRSRLKGRRSKYANPHFCSSCGQRIDWRLI